MSDRNVVLTEGYTDPAMYAEHESSRATGEAYAFSVTDILGSLWRRLWIILLTVTLVTGVAVGWGIAQTPEYEASIKVLIGLKQEGDESDNLAGNVQGLQEITQTMTEAVGTRPIAEEVIRRLNLRMTPEQFLKHLTAEQIGATQFVQITFKDNDPRLAQQAANAVGDVFSERVAEVSPGASAVTATVWERAEVPRDPASPNIKLYAVAALALGLMLGVGLALLVEYLDDRWRSPEEVEQISGVPNMGVIPHFKVQEAESLQREKGKAKDVPFAQEGENQSVAEKG